MLFRLVSIVLLALALSACGGLNFAQLQSDLAYMETAADRDLLVYAAKESAGRRDDFQYTSQLNGVMRLEATYAPKDSEGCQVIPVRRTWQRADGSIYVGRYEVEFCQQAHPQPTIKTIAEYKEPPKENG